MTTMYRGYTWPMKKLIYSVVMSITVAVTLGTGAMAAPRTAPTTSPSTLGVDVSYPQCGTKLPSGQAFAIVGVNGGLANNNNPCLTQQLDWAAQTTGITSQPKVSLYVNTANPGLAATVWPTNNSYNGISITNPYGECAGAEGVACAYVYGWTRAYQDVHERNVPNPTNYKWWLDVETTNSWSTTDLAANAASLEGMVDYFKSVGVPSIGVYSTNYQWNTIVGSNLSSTSSLNGLDSWMAGARTQRGAEQNCTNPPFTPTGRVVLGQFVSKGLDYNVSCI